MSNRTAPTPEVDDGTGGSQFINGSVTYTLPVVISVRKGTVIITEGDETVFDSSKHKRQVINGPVTYNGGVTFNVG